MTRIELLDGKYTVVNELEEGGGFRALRYGEEWRNLAGDNLVLAMAYEIEELREQLTDKERALADNFDHNDRVEAVLYDAYLKTRCGRNTKALSIIKEYGSGRYE